MSVSMKEEMLSNSLHDAKDLEHVCLLGVFLSIFMNVCDVHVFREYTVAMSKLKLLHSKKEERKGKKGSENTFEFRGILTTPIC